MAVHDGLGRDYFEEAIHVAFPIWAGLKADARAFPRLPPVALWMQRQGHRFQEYLDGMAVLAQVSKGRALLTDNPEDLRKAGFLPMAILACMQPEMPREVEQQFMETMESLWKAGYRLPKAGRNPEADIVLDHLRTGFMASRLWKGTGDVYSLYTREPSDE